MLPDAVDNYLAQVARVLKPGGRCLVTWFLLDDASRLGMTEGRAAFAFRHPLPGCVVANAAAPEDAVAYDEQTVLELYRRHGLAIATPIRYGRWSGRTDGLSFQDVVVARAGGGVLVSGRP